MKLKIVLAILLMLAPSIGSATGYTWGYLEEWKERLAAAEEFLEFEGTEAESKFDADKRAAAMSVYGFIHGISDGHMIDRMAKLKSQYGEDIPHEKIDEDYRTICFDEAYFEMIPKLINFIESKKYSNDEEFAMVFLDFVMEEYMCE
ncbi:MAG: hypothetical protein AAF431_12400 [Pseudomonadota bacterium]